MKIMKTMHQFVRIIVMKRTWFNCTVPIYFVALDKKIQALGWMF